MGGWVWVILGGLLAVLVTAIILSRGSGKKPQPSQDVDEESIATKRIQ
jgi:hypothetical protein